MTDDRGTGQWKRLEEVPRRTSLVPLAFPCFVHCLIGVETKERFRLPGAGGGSFPLYGGTFARSYSVSKKFHYVLGMEWVASEEYKLLERFLCQSESRKRGGNSGDPLTYDMFPPPPPAVCPHPVSFEEAGADQTNIIFWDLPNWLWRAHSIVRFPPQNLQLFSN